MRIAVVLHHPDETPDVFAEALEEAGARLDVFPLYESPAPPDAEGYDGFLLMGGPQSANDDHDAMIRAELAWLARDVVPSAKPVFGVCLGAQLLAKAAGGRIVPAARRELGFFRVRPTAAALQDPVFSSLPGEGLVVFQWHGETWILPRGAVRLATAFQVPEQAFRLAPGQYGIQFHPEVHPATIRRWVEIGEDERAALGEAGIARIFKEVPQYLAAMHAWARQAMRAWLEDAFV